MQPAGSHTIFSQKDRYDVICDRFLRRKKEVMHDSIVAVLHRKRVGHVLEAGDFSQAIAEGGNDRLVVRLTISGGGKKPADDFP
jgi:hypothetical protein